MLKSIRFASIDKVPNLFIRTAHTQYSQFETTVNGLESDFTVPFASARLGNFNQPQPEFGNFLQQDKTLAKILNRNIPQKVKKKLTKMH